MKFFRIRLLLLAFWFIFLFNLERIDFNFVGLSNINLDTWVYILAAGISVVILVLPDLAPNLVITFVPTLILYMIIKSLSLRTVSTPTPVYLIVTEVMALFVTILITRQIALGMEDFEQAVENVLLKPNNLRVLSEAEVRKKSISSCSAPDGSNAPSVFS